MSEIIFCGLYVRVSTEEQAREGLSIQNQVSRLKEFAVEQDWVIENLYLMMAIQPRI